MIYLFNASEQLIKIVPSAKVVSAFHTQTLTSERYVSELLEVEVLEMTADEVDQVGYIGIQSKNDKYQYHLFFVSRSETENGVTTLFGTQSAVEELRKTVIKDKRPSDTTLGHAVTDILTGTNWSARYTSDGARKSTYFYYSSVFDALKKACDVWDVEMQFFVQVNGNKIGARYIDFKKKLGENNGARVVYGHNAVKILEQSEKTDLFTALIGRGKGEQVSDGSENESGRAGYGRRITFSDIEWRKSEGKPIDKPRGLEYVEIPSATRRYGVKTPEGWRPKIGVVEFGEEDDAEVLLQRTYERLLQVCRPSILLKTSTAYLKNVGIGDTVRVVHKRRKLDVATRVVEVRWNRLDNTSTDVKIGNQTNVSESVRLAHANSENEIATERIINRRIQPVLDHWASANGKNSLWTSEDDPLSVPSKRNLVKVGDVWYKPDPAAEGETIVVRWNGEHWEEIMRTYKWREVEQKTEEIGRKAEALNQSIQTTNTQVEAISRKATGAENAAERAKAIAEETRVSVTNRLSNIRSDVHEILQANFDRLKGQSSYLHVAYASDVSGSRVTGFSKTDTTGKEWLGTQSTSSATASDNPNDYTWVKLPQGERGRDGASMLNLIKDSYTLKSAVLYEHDKFSNPSRGTIEILIENNGEKFLRISAVREGKGYVGGVLNLYLKELEQNDKLSFNFQYREQSQIAPITQQARLSIIGGLSWVGTYGIPRTNNSEWNTVKQTISMSRKISSRHNFQIYFYLPKNGCIDIKLPMLVKGEIIPEDYSANPADAILEMSTFSASYERDNQRVRENLQELQHKFNASGELTSLAEFKRQYEATARGVSEQLSAHVRSITGATDTITSLNREMNAVKGSLETKVSQSTYDQLNSRVSTAESKIQQNANGLATKVSRSDHDRLANRMTSAESSIRQTANELSNKVSVTTHNQLTNRVSSAETSIRQTATELAEKISQSDFDPVNQKVTTLYNDTKATVEAFKRVLGSDESTVRRNFLKAARTENLVKNPRFEFQLAEWTQQYLDGSTQTFGDRPDGVSGDKASLRVKATSRITSGCNIHQRINVGELYRDQTIVVGANVAVNNAPNSGTIFEIQVKYEGTSTTNTEFVTIDRYRIRTNYWSWFERQLTVPIDCHAITLSIYFNKASRNSIDLFITDVTLAVTDMSLGGPIRAAFDTAYSAVEQTKEYIRTELFKTTGSDSGTTSLRTFIESVAGSKTERYTKQEVENRINASKSAIEQNIRGQFQHVQSDHAKLERLFGTTQNGEVTHFARQLVTNEIFTTEIQNAVPRNLVADGYVNDSSNLYGFATRKIRLEKGKQYTFTASGKVTGVASGKQLSVWLFRTSSWDDERYSISFTSTTYSIKSVTFTAKVSEEYTLISALSPSGGNRQGTADILWYVVTEGTHVAKAYINNDEAVASKVHQLSNSWGVNIRSANDVITNLNLNASGVKIKGKFIELDGDVSIDKAFVNNMFVQMITGDTATFDRGTFAYVLAEHIDVNRLTGRKIEFIEAAFRDHFGVVKITGSDIKIDSYQDWDVLLDRRGMMITNASGTPMGSFVGYIDKGTGNDSGIAMIAKKGYELSLGYDGVVADSTFNSAVVLDGTTGQLTLQTDIYPSLDKNAVGLSFANRNINNEKCVYLYVPNSPGYGIAIGRSGVYVLNNDRYTKLGSSY